ncbi:UNVERIFIED_ORG: hypothetical protein J2W75_001033 [Methylorubrum zatmanii]|uniref:DUF3617 domain-containing protein n=1 Tax=Methylorubrum TaxID=2282523 RepID=UPI00352E65BB|nr:hypothetical protein [Methylorubrum extorquens]
MAALLAGPAVAAEPIVLEGGAYEVEVKLELPHLDEITGKKVARLCLTPEANGNNHGIAVLSDNNPLARCPVSNVHQDGNELTFDTACEGKNSAHASVRYLLAPTSFRGRNAMQMGGKNMTMTEVQSGCQRGRFSSQSWISLVLWVAAPPAPLKAGRKPAR